MLGETRKKTRPANALMAVLFLLASATACDNGQLDEDQASQDLDAVGASEVWQDDSSGLMWQVLPPQDGYEQGQADFYCESLILGGYSDWRIPTIGELRSLIRGCPGTEPGGTCTVNEDECIEWECRKSCIGCSNYGGPGAGGMYWPAEVAGDCDSGCSYLSSTLAVGHDPMVWVVHFNNGGVDTAHIYDDSGSLNDGYRVRCVR